MYAVVLLVCCSWVALLCPSAQAYENLALHKPTWQSSTWGPFTADLAVDGRGWNGGQCAESNGGQTAEWRVDLGGVKNIHHVFIQYATGNEVWANSLGFSVYISNTTNKEDGVLCFRDTNYTKATIPNPVNITCPYHGGYVIYYNNRTHPPYPEGYSGYADTLLCEVEVYGCDVYTYGLDCKRCGNCSGGVQCDHVTGTCPNGCDPVMYGDKCDRECSISTYGVTCKESCGNCSNGEPCHHVDGSCPSGCNAGSYGVTCKESCGNCSNGETCHHVDGSCPSGCNAGWYGVTCKESCGNCSNGELCHHVDGSCPSGCNAGSYGVTCKESCGNCSNGEPCHHVDGSCRYGCDVGVYGKTCDEACQPGRYGINCGTPCGPNCQGCNRFTGFCEFGCLPGWTGPSCEKRSNYMFRYRLSY
uniref:Multiple epidermal growth factor-like domains protein 10 n=1 Tax=Crassostrea virginica TaxID=6565 RepID=A0A8B8BJS5_CRAVI|nr:multiple epidermal growth factor-like domains protein 10 [Crassostrea virginica]XP_022303549.1 multiple epidermal growth factor-like domains protein 10 [Crassostrea virginica]